MLLELDEPTGCMSMPLGFFFKCWVDLDLHFYERVNFVPNASVWVTAYRALSALVFPSVCSNSALRCAIQDQWSSGLSKLMISSVACS